MSWKGLVTKLLPPDAPGIKHWFLTMCFIDFDRVFKVLHKWCIRLKIMNLVQKWQVFMTFTVQEKLFQKFIHGAFKHWISTHSNLKIVNTSSICYPVHIEQIWYYDLTAKKIITWMFVTLEYFLVISD